MGSEDITDLAGDPRFIPGIYNYCDRWCERCPFSARCLTYAMEQREGAGPEARDPRNAAFWERLHETFQATLELLKDIAEREGIDLESGDAEAAAAERGRDQEARKNHPLARAAKAYAKMVDEWFGSADARFERKQDELNLKLELEVRQSDPHVEATTIADATEVLRWYQHQISVKLMRAISGAARDEPSDPPEYPKDSDGSAKVALIAMDRSIGAWGVLRQHFPEEGDTIIGVLAHLSRLRRRTEQALPNARGFIRPGFDAIPD